MVLKYILVIALHHYNLYTYMFILYTYNYGLLILYISPSTAGLHYCCNQHNINITWNVTICDAHAALLYFWLMMPINLLIKKIEHVLLTKRYHHDTSPVDFLHWDSQFSQAEAIQLNKNTQKSTKVVSGTFHLTCEECFQPPSIRVIYFWAIRLKESQTFCYRIFKKGLIWP